MHGVHVPVVTPFAADGAERGLIEHAAVRAPLRAAGATSVAAALDVLKVLET